MPENTTTTKLDLSTAESVEEALVSLFPALAGVDAAASRYAAELAGFDVATRNTIRLSFHLAAQTALIERLLAK
ncbi:hypothetical protein [Cryobacterium sp. SO1]|uniref:hypothetical protein n=1 Tax=Cryobacterium sp. SO1 TaxID=1897061 RepID=UPI001022CC5B|nr:hypothetical protein [Cryobacterium sp. SO1]RZI36980.1 hypothetical protein BJQ95_00647 [Cryobacterium sp. SO1]